MHDINELQTALKKAQDRIADLEQSSSDNLIFLNIFNSLPVPFGISNEAGNIINLNTTFIKTFGYDHKEIPTLNDWWPKAYPDPKYREWVLKTWQDRVNSSQTTNTDFEAMEVNIRCKNGAVRTALVSAAPLTNSSVGNFLVIFFDITEMKEAKDEIGDLSNSLASMSKSLKQQNEELMNEKEKALANEERLRLAMLGANDGLWDWDLTNDKIYFSPRWKSMLGYAEHEIEDLVLTWKELLHPDDLEPSLAAIEFFMDKKTDKYEAEFRMRHKDNHYVNILSRAFAVESEDGKITRLVGTHEDITERKKTEEKLNFQSSHDSLTGLVNRGEFEVRTELLLSTSTNANEQHALCYIDLDQFKVINDTSGHAAGDEMLRQLSAILQKVIRPSDTLARLGGDEFAVLLQHCSIAQAQELTEIIHSAIQEFQFLWESRSFRIGASVGLVPININTVSLTELLKNADVACYIAKDQGRNRIHLHSEDDSELAKRQGEMQWVRLIQQALDENRFCLYAQAIESLQGSHKAHYELLVRMVDETGKIIPPGAFLPAAERYNLITQLDRWVVENAISLLKSNPDFLGNTHFISINLSGQSLTDDGFLKFVVEQMQGLDANCTKICFEITETAAISNLLLATEFMNELRKFGCLFALDDFGSGLSSFAYLKSLSVDYLKIDGAFVKDIFDDPIDRAMVKSINEIGHVMGMRTIAEFVENKQIKTMLKNIGVDYAQGYGIHKPQSFLELLQQFEKK